MVRDVRVEEHEAGQRHEVREIESFVGMLAVLRVEFLLVNSHAGGDEEGDGQEGDAENPVEEHQRGIVICRSFARVCSFGLFLQERGELN